MKHAFLKLIPALLLCVLLLTACSAKPAETVQMPAPTPTTDIYAATPAPTPTPMSEADQRALIERSRPVWEPDLEYETWFFAVTDLDANGRLEAVTASLQGTGLYTWVNVWEVNENYTGLTLCQDNTGEGEAWPDIIKDTLTYYRDPASGRQTYVCEDYMRDGAAHYWTGLDSFCLENGRIDVKILASKDEVYNEQGTSTIRYFDANGTETSGEAWNNAERSAFAGQEQRTLSLSWTQLEKQAQPTPQPMVTAPPQYTQPQVTAQPQVGGPVTITKNPTGESLAAGGNAWFIAHADNATSLTWILTSPQGQSFTVEQAMVANPGLQIQVLPEDTLGVSNVPASVDGWSVQARFDGPGGSAVTAPAVIHVDDTVTAYGSVISAYYRAYTTGNTTAEYAFSNGLSEYITSAPHVGYALQDINGDGVQELIIAGINDSNYTEIVIFDLYTLENGQPVQLACTSARSRWFLRSDGSVLNEGSNGAGNSIFVVNRLYGSSLTPIESAMTWYEGGERDGCYHQTDGYNYEPRDYDEYLTEQQFTQLVTYWESSVVVPHFVGQIA